MRPIRIVIADENQEYSKALSEYLQSEYGQAFDIYCFTNTKALFEHLNNNQDIDIMLIGQDLFENSINTQKIRLILVLTDSNMESEINGVPALYKYQLGDKLAKQIMQHYDASQDGKYYIHAQQQEGRLIAVYSPAGGSGKSVVAYNLARQYAMQGKKTILISFESYASLSIFKSESKTQGLSYLIYLIRNKATNLQVKLDSIKELDMDSDVHYIPRSCNALDYKDIGKDDVVSLLEFLKTQSGYHAIILDMDSGISEILLSVLKHCDVVLNVVTTDLVGKRKNEDFVKQLYLFNNLLDIKLQNKMLLVNNKVENQLIMSAEELDNNTKAFNIPYLKDILSTENGYYPELIHFKKLYEAVENSFTEKRLQA